MMLTTTFIIIMIKYYMLLQRAMRVCVSCTNHSTILLLLISLWPSVRCPPSCRHSVLCWQRQANAVRPLSLSHIHAYTHTHTNTAKFKKINIYPFVRHFDALIIVMKIMNTNNNNTFRRCVCFNHFFRCSLTSLSSSSTRSLCHCEDPHYSLLI